MLTQLGQAHEVDLEPADDSHAVHITPHGFRFGPMSVTRIHGSNRLGWFVEVTAGREVVTVSCSPKGNRMQIARGRKG